MEGLCACLFRAAHRASSFCRARCWELLLGLSRQHTILFPKDCVVGHEGVDRELLEQVPGEVGTVERADSEDQKASLLLCA